MAEVLRNERFVLLRKNWSRPPMPNDVFNFCRLTSADVLMLKALNVTLRLVKSKVVFVKLVIVPASVMNQLLALNVLPAKVLFCAGLSARMP